MYVVESAVLVVPVLEEYRAAATIATAISPTTTAVAALEETALAGFSGLFFKWDSVPRTFQEKAAAIFQRIQCRVRSNF